MAHTGIFATSSEILTKAGENYDTSVTEAKINELCLQAESSINDLTNFNWSDVFTSSLNVDKKYVLTEAESNLVAIYIINYNMGGYTSRLEAQTMIDILYTGFWRCIKVLQSAQGSAFVQTNP